MKETMNKETMNRCITFFGKDVVEEAGGENATAASIHKILRAKDETLEGASDEAFLKQRFTSYIGDDEIVITKKTKK
jgi:hypothetical protein